MENMEIGPKDETSSRSEFLDDDVNSSLDDYSIVYFDLETSGFQKTADILQIAAKCEDEVFSVYVNPSQPVDPFASEITGLENINGELFVRGKKVISITLEEALKAFLEFLNLSSLRCILVAHNARFDSSRLIRAIINNSMVESFGNKIVGFSDSLLMFKRLFPDRKGQGLFKLETLAKDLLQIEPTGNFHEATYDVDILATLVASCIQRKDLMENNKSYRKAVALSSLDVLKGTVSYGMLTKIAEAGICYEELMEVQRKSGREGIVQLLSEQMIDNNKPRVTSNKKVLEKIYIFLENQ